MKQLDARSACRTFLSRVFAFRRSTALTRSSSRFFHVGLTRCVWLILTLFGTHAHAQTSPYVPAELRQWVPWVLAAEPQRACPAINSAAECEWPGRLSLELNEAGGRFRLNVVADSEVDVVLPGGLGQWPIGVRSSDGPLIVLDAGGSPTVRVPAGGIDIEGTFVWSKLPDTLALPERLALVQVRIDGRPVERPRRDPNLLWLAEARAIKGDEDKLSIEAFRRVEVGSPLLITTWLELSIAGKSREVNLGKIWLEGGVPLDITTDLPARLEPDLSVVVQLLPGTHRVRLLQSLPANATQLTSPALPPPWPVTEVWSLLPNDTLRQVRIENADAVDAERSNVPEEWRTLASYRVAQGTQVSLLTERRGDPSPPPNQLSITRDLWLDLDGNGWTARDQMSAVFNQGVRLDRTFGELGHARLEEDPQLITAAPGTAQSGIELRRGKANLQAHWRQNGAMNAMPAVGWSENAESLSVNLHLPPGYELLGASGVDRLSDSWVGSWDLFALFYVLLVALVTMKLAHPAWGALGLLVLVLTHNQPEAPNYVWLTLLTQIAILRLLPASLFRRFLVGATAFSALSLVVMFVSFSILQVRSAIYPQVQPGAAMSAPFAARQAPEESAAVEMKEGGMGSRAYAEAKIANDAPAGAAAKPPQLPASESKEVIQTGPGIPEWQFKSWQLDWSGPVHREHTMRLYLLTPWVNALLAFLRVTLGALLAWLILRLALNQAGRPARHSLPPSPAAIAGISFFLFLAASFYSRPAAAELPDTALLEELKRRVTMPAACEPNCMTASRARLELHGEELKIRVELGSQTKAAYPLPGPAKDWTPDEVRVNGTPVGGLLLHNDGSIYLRVEPGSHVVDLSGPLPGNSFSLKWQLSPKRLEVDAPGWEITGLGESGQVNDIITLHRKLPSASAQGGVESAALNGWLNVRRTFHLGTTWTVDTQVDRIVPNTSVTARIPLLPFERVTSDSIHVQQGVAIVTLDRGSESLTFRSTLTPTPLFTLKASSGQPFSERWIFDCSAIWHCSFEGVVPTERQVSGALQPLFVPDPGEELRVTAVKPDAAPGLNLTVDSARLVVTPGTRLEQATLTMQVRAATQRPLVVHLPTGAELQQLTVDQAPQPLSSVNDNKLVVQVSPGAHQIALQWQRSGAMTLMYHSAAVHLEAPIANATTSIHIPDGRWLLLAGGHGWGPAILFWGYLALLLLLTPVLGHTPGSPLRTKHWLLLTIGLTQIPVVALIAIVGWFFALAHIRSWRPLRRGFRNTSQVLLVLWTAVFLSCTLAAVYGGLLSSPDMAVEGGDSTSHQLVWYLDKSAGTLPTPWVFSTSLWLYRGAMLAWALWLSGALLRWLKWGFEQFSLDGLWLKATPHLPLGPTPAVSPVGAPRAPRSGWGSVFYPRGMPENLKDTEPEPPTLRREPMTPIPGSPASGADAEAPPSSIMAPTHLTFPELFVAQPNVVGGAPSQDEDRHTMPDAGLLAAKLAESIPSADVHSLPQPSSTASATLEDAPAPNLNADNAEEVLESQEAAPASDAATSSAEGPSTPDENEATPASDGETQTVISESMTPDTDSTASEEGEQASPELKPRDPA